MPKAVNKVAIISCNKHNVLVEVRLSHLNLPLL